MRNAAADVPDLVQEVFLRLLRLDNHEAIRNTQATSVSSSSRLGSDNRTDGSSILFPFFGDNGCLGLQRRRPRQSTSRASTKPSTARCLVPPRPILK